MSKIPYSIIAGFIFCLLPYPALSQESNLKVIELYTSQGCSSCPPADTFLSELSLNTSNITLACHVTYWDYLGWKDSFSNPFCDKRQYQYKRYLKTPSAYTPQIIINGRYQGVGSQRAKIWSLLKASEKDDNLLALKINSTTSKLLIDISAIKTQENLELYIVGVGKSESVVIKKGENKNRTIDYHNPVIFSRLVSINTETKDRIIEDISDTKESTAKDIAQWVILAQEIKTGRIIAVGRISKNKQELARYTL